MPSKRKTTELKAGRGHAFSRVGAGRSTKFADKRRSARATEKIKQKKDSQ